MMHEDCAAGRGVRHLVGDRDICLQLNLGLERGHGVLRVQDDGEGSASQPRHRERLVKVQPHWHLAPLRYYTSIERFSIFISVLL